MFMSIRFLAMKSSSLYLLLMLAVSLVCLPADAKKQREPKPIVPQRVWIYGCGVNFLDSVVFVTDIQYVDSAIIDREGQLENSYAYSSDLKFFVESRYAKENEACAVYYSPKLKAVEKRYARMKKRFASKHLVVNMIGGDSFQFTKQ